MAEHSKCTHGSNDGAAVGMADGDAVGLLVGIREGPSVGDADGAKVYLLQAKVFSLVVSNSSISSCVVITLGWVSVETHSASSASQPHWWSG